jgi:hypothetical protein
MLNVLFQSPMAGDVYSRASRLVMLTVLFQSPMAGDISCSFQTSPLVMLTVLFQGPLAGDVNCLFQSLTVGAVNCLFQSLTVLVGNNNLCHGSLRQKAFFTCIIPGTVSVQ